MSYEKIQATRYKCRCEAKSHNGITCGHKWESDSLSRSCPRCQSRLWNGPDKRKKRMLTHRGETLCVTDWSKKLGIPRMTIYQRLWRGWEVDDVLDPSTFAPGPKPKEAVS